MVKHIRKQRERERELGDREHLPVFKEGNRLDGSGEESCLPPKLLQTWTGPRRVVP